MSKDSIIGIDLAKNVFHVCIMNGAGRVLRRKRLARQELLNWVVQHGTGAVAFEACGGSHYWGRKFEELGFEVRMLPAQFVKPFVKSNKNDVVDAEAICEAASRPQMRKVALRSEDQQDIQNLHRVRERLTKSRTALVNEIRGLLLEYGIVIPKGINKARALLPEIIESLKSHALRKETFQRLYEELTELDAQIDHYESRLETFCKSNEVTKRLTGVPGVGAVSATAIYAAVGNPKEFKNGRQFAAWVGLTPKQYSTGGKTRLGRISKRGDKYLRKLLVLGARANAIAADRRLKKKTDRATDRWLLQIANRRGGKRAVVALANKMARQIWVVLNGEPFKHHEELFPVAA